MGSVALHELCFGNLGGYRRAGPNSGLGRPDWHEVPDAFASEIAADFGSAGAWRRPRGTISPRRTTTRR